MKKTKQTVPPGEPTVLNRVDLRTFAEVLDWVAVAIATPSELVVRIAVQDEKCRIQTDAVKRWVEGWVRETISPGTTVRWEEVE